MKKKAGVHICLAAALFGYTPTLSGGYLISLLVVASFLTLSSFSLFFHSITSASWWIKVVDTFNRVEVSYPAAGFGLVLAGASLIKPVWFPLGVVFIAAGALTIGAGLGMQLGKISLIRKISLKCYPISIRICAIRVMGLRGKLKICDSCLCRFPCYTLSNKKAT